MARSRRAVAREVPVCRAPLDLLIGKAKFTIPIEECATWRIGRKSVLAPSGSRDMFYVPRSLYGNCDGVAGDAVHRGIDLGALTRCGSASHGSASAALRTASAGRFGNDPTPYRIYVS